MTNARSRARSNKAKGRTGQQEVQRLILEHFPELEADDCRSTSMGSDGEDILLSPAARKLIPFQLEVKRKKAIGVMRFIEQASTHGKHEPLAIFREDRGDWHVCLSAATFFKLLRK